MVSQNVQPTEPATIPARRPIKRLILFFLAFSAAVALIIGLTLLLIFNSVKASVTPPQHAGKAVIAGATVNTLTRLSGDNVFPMGLAVAPDGSLYLSEFGTGVISKLESDGSLSPFIKVGGALTAAGAIAFGPDKMLYVIDYNSTNPQKSAGTLRRITPDGQITTWGVTPGGKNFPMFAQLSMDGAGNLYATNPSSGEVWRFDPSGKGAVWWAASASGSTSAQPTGITFDASRNALIVGDAGTGSVYRVSLGTDGMATNPVLLYRQAGLDVQGLALDATGRVVMLAWAHDNGQLSRLDKDGTATLLADGFRTPTALVYEDNRVYIVNSDLLGLVPPLLFGLMPSPPLSFTVDVVDLSKAGGTS